MSETILAIETSPQDIQRRIDAGEPLTLIDVREPEEFAITRIEGATLIPMRNIPANLQQLEAKADETTLIVFCHHGVRSLNVVHWLREQGVTACQSMAGGIDAWSALVDTVGSAVLTLPCGAVGSLRLSLRTMESIGGGMLEAITSLNGFQTSPNPTSGQLAGTTSTSGEACGRMT